MKQDNYIDDIIESIHNIEKQKVSPFFKSKVLARLDSTASANAPFVFKPAFILALATLLLLVNTLLLSNSISNNDSSFQNNIGSSEQDLSNEYSYNINSSIYLYDDKQ